jgi:Bacterial archaeo-eukaryotic release factor family 3
MDNFTRDDLKSLLAVQDAHCLTITLPADPAQPQAAPILLKNLHREALRQLGTRGLRANEARQILGPIEALIGDPIFWREQAGGLAIFRARDFVRTFRVPLALQERVTLRDRFLLSPLIPMLAGDGRFYILALSQKRIRLLEGSRAGAVEVSLEDVPVSLAEALQGEWVEKGTQYRARQGSAGGQHAASMTGYGSGPEEDDKARIERFFREVDRGLQPILRGERAPLVLFGVDYLLPIYRDVNTYPHLVEGGVTGSPDILRPAELHQKAWPIAQTIFEREQDAAIAQFEHLSKSERASSDLHQVIPAAYYGRVDTLLMARGSHQAGRFDAQTGKVVVHKTARPEAEDLPDLAAIQTLLHDGDVFPLDPECVPHNSMLAAIFRY